MHGTNSQTKQNHLKWLVKIFIYLAVFNGKLNITPMCYKYLPVRKMKNRRRASLRTKRRRRTGPRLRWLTSDISSCTAKRIEKDFKE